MSDNVSLSDMNEPAGPRRFPSLDCRQSAAPQMPGILPLTALLFPAWARPGRRAAEPAEDASFQAGAGLALVGLTLAAPPPAAGAWLDRQALAAAAASLAAAGRLEDEA